VSTKHGSKHDYGDQLAESDRLFAYFVRGLLGLLLLYGVAMALVLLFGSEQIGIKMLNAFASMFTGIIGLGSGYLLGKRNGPDSPNSGPGA
jgi:hypothetical protein